MLPSPYQQPSSRWKIVLRRDYGGTLVHAPN
jgi:hypothetical protein